MLPEIAWRCRLLSLRPRMKGAAMKMPCTAAYLAAVHGIFIAAPFILGLRDNRRHRQAISGSIYGDKRQIGGADVTALFGTIILHPDLHAYLHRSVVHAIDRRTQDYEISNPNRHEKIQMIDGRSHDICARVAMGGHRAG